METPLTELLKIRAHLDENANLKDSVDRFNNVINKEYPVIELGDMESVREQMDYLLYQQITFCMTDFIHNNEVKQKLQKIIDINREHTYEREEGCHNLVFELQNELCNITKQLKYVSPRLNNLQNVLDNAKNEGTVEWSETAHCAESVLEEIEEVLQRNSVPSEYEIHFDGKSFTIKYDMLTELKFIQSMNIQLKKALNNKTVENANLKRMVESSKINQTNDLTKERDEAIEKNRQLSNKLKDMEAQINVLETEKDMEAQKSNQLDIELKEKDQQIGDLMRKAEEAKKNEELSSQLKEKDEKIKSLEELINKKNEESSSQLKEKDEKIKSLEELINKKNEESSSQLKEKIKNLEESINEKDNTISQLNTQIEENKKQIGELKSSADNDNKTIAQLNSKLVEKDKKIEELNNLANVDGDEKMGQLKSQLEAKEEQIKNLNDKLEIDLAKNNEELNQVKAKIDDIVRMMEDMDAYPSEEEVVQDNTDEFVPILVVSPRDNDSTELSKKLKKLEDGYNKLKDNYNKLKDEYNKLKEDNSGLQERFNNINSLYNSLKDECNGLRQQVERMENEKLENERKRVEVTLGDLVNGINIDNVHVIFTEEILNSMQMGERVTVNNQSIYFWYNQDPSCHIDGANLSCDVSIPRAYENRAVAVVLKCNHSQERKFKVNAIDGNVARFKGYGLKKDSGKEGDLFIHVHIN